MMMDRERLLEKVKANRGQHARTYREALAAYRQRAAEWHTAQAASIAAGGEVQRALHLPEPEEHIEDYDAAIGMLTWGEDRQVEVDEETFRRLVNDEWDWSGRFSWSTSSYTSR
jgi:hypothetical protein